MNLKTIDGLDLIRALRGGCANLEKHREQVDMLNVFPVPDGDTGTNMYLTISSAFEEAEKNVQAFLGKVMKTISTGSLMGARGNSGVILSQIFRGMAKELGSREKANAQDMARALKSGADTAYKAVMKPVEGTILTVIREIARGSAEKAEESEDVLAVLRAGVQAGNEILLKTPQMLPILKEAGVVDSAGQGLLFFLQGFVAGLAGEAEDEETPEEQETGAFAVSDAEEAETMAYPYCTELFVKCDPEKKTFIKSELKELGEELCAQAAADGVKVHIHSNHPGKVLECCMEHGLLTNITIRNLSCKEPEVQTVFETEEKAEEAVLKKIGLVAVAAGDGLVDILKSLGVDEIVHGGQTMNPSTQDILNACNRVAAENIIVLPNNSNIIMAANQVRDICEKNVIVLPTKNVMQAIAALVVFDADADVETVEANMLEEMARVTYGELTSAVRDAQIDGVEVKTGDFIGLVEGHIKADGTDKEEVLLVMMREMVEEDHEIITMLYGADVQPEEAQAMQEKMQAEFDWCETELHYGGQAHYDYLVSVE